MTADVEEVYGNVTKLIFGVATGLFIGLGEFLVAGIFAVAYSVMFVSGELRELRREVADK